MKYSLEEFYEVELRLNGVLRSLPTEVPAWHFGEAQYGEVLLISLLDSLY